MTDQDFRNRMMVAGADASRVEFLISSGIFRQHKSNPTTWKYFREEANVQAQKLGNPLPFPEVQSD